MQETKLTQKAMLDLVMDVFDQQLPFNRFLGLQIERTNFDKATIRLNWQDNLMGNPYQKILHGGVTAAILDTVGGLMAMLYVAKDLNDLTADEFRQRIARIGTIDMRVDYLRPGKGEEFTATAEMIRKGNKVAVCRMELHNEKGTHIAFGTATYML
ncbi:thioesterase family protein [Planctobacterium marinum]|uniref:thioesterase family protein n=1 Tax=Planctobacterium marinum TaxID=1631968 RepID=UPI001E284EEB|nr:thioesterase family protein [Planctobacterium marinum]MCC2607036.1 thioesterase family protein [Planctobacterium marinum]